MNRDGRVVSKDRITRNLMKLGAGWAGTSGKCILPGDPGTMDGTAKATWHVHPDRSDPQESAILRFRRLADIAGYIETRKRAGAAFDAGDCILAERLMEWFWESLSD